MSGAAMDIGAYEVFRPIVLQALWTGSQFTFRFNGTPGSTYTVLCSTNLSLPLSAWTVLGPAMQIAPGEFEFTASDTANHPASFYTVLQP